MRSLFLVFFTVGAYAGTPVGDMLAKAAKCLRDARVSEMQLAAEEVLVGLHEVIDLMTEQNLDAHALEALLTIYKELELIASGLVPERRELTTGSKNSCLRATMRSPYGYTLKRLEAALDDVAESLASKVTLSVIAEQFDGVMLRIVQKLTDDRRVSAQRDYSNLRGVSRFFKHLLSRQDVVAAVRSSRDDLPLLQQMTYAQFKKQEGYISDAVNITVDTAEQLDALIGSQEFSSF